MHQRPAKAWAETFGYDLGCQKNLGRPVNDLLDLRMEEQTLEKDRESVATNGVSEAGEKAKQGIECRHGRSSRRSPWGTTNCVPHQVKISNSLSFDKSSSARATFPPTECKVRIDFLSAHGCRGKVNCRGRRLAGAISPNFEG